MTGKYSDGQKFKFWKLQIGRGVTALKLITMGAFKAPISTSH